MDANGQGQALVQEKGHPHIVRPAAIRLLEFPAKLSFDGEAVLLVQGYGDYVGGESTKPELLHSPAPRLGNGGVHQLVADPPTSLVGGNN